MASISISGQNSGLQMGSNHAPMHNYFTAQQSEPRPQPFSTVPFPPDPNFVGRDALLDRIRDKSSVPGSRIVLVGLGGVGKTGLVIEYCHRVRKLSAHTWIFWVHCSTAARCEESLRDLANRARIPGRQNHDADIFQLFRNWLQDDNIGEWILVLDNVDDDELLRKPPATHPSARYASTQTPLGCLLEVFNGSIIVTSRNKKVALEIAGQENLIDVQPMIAAEAVDLLQNKLDSETAHDTKKVAQLVEELEYMPLAIVQAASYIVHHSIRCSVATYLGKLRQSDRHAKKLLDHEGLHAQRDREAKNSISLTWQISFDHIRATQQSAADLLSLMSFFNWQAIPESLLREQVIEEDSGSSENSFTSSKDATIRPSEEEREEIYTSSSEEDTTDSESEYDLEDSFESDIATLRDYSLITAIGTKDNMVFAMHRLVQLTVRTWLKSVGQDEKWKELFISNLNHAFPTGYYEDWEICRPLFPHVKSAISYQPKSKNRLLDLAALLHRGACYARESGNFFDSEEMAILSRKYRISILGAEDAHTMNSSSLLAAIYSDLGRLDKAEQLLIQVVETRKMKLSANHPETLDSMFHLAMIYRYQGRQEEAEELMIQVMEAYNTKLTVDHSDIPVRMGNLASIYREQDWLEEAEQLQRQVVEAHKTKLGVDHPNTLIGMGNLASIYKDQGRLEEAEQLFIQVAEAHKTKLDIDHPDTLIGMSNLASTYKAQGRPKEAEQLLIQMTEAYKTKLGIDHPDTLIGMSNLASTYRAQGRPKEAEQLLIQVAEAYKRKLDTDHPNMLHTIASLAAVYYDQGRLEEAEQLERQLLESCEIKFGVDHPHTLIIMDNLAHTFWSSGQHKAALSLMAECVRRREQRLGPGHPTTINSGYCFDKWMIIALGSLFPSLFISFHRPRILKRRFKPQSAPRRPPIEFSRLGGHRRRVILFCYWKIHQSIGLESLIPSTHARV